MSVYIDLASLIPFVLGDTTVWSDSTFYSVILYVALSNVESELLRTAIW